jgi:hypothetical protein
MRFQVIATIEDSQVYQQLIESVDLIGILTQLHDSNIKDKSEYAEFQRAELKYAIDLLIKRRNKEWENKK